uniref:Chromatin-remodeling ATPase INO80 n=1 Tax=Petromyzon marinus TaxID=7757 RepID=S4S086_PETMA
FKVLPYWGNPHDRKVIRKFWSQDAPFHVVITSYQLVVQDVKYFQRVKWQYMVLDEAQALKSSTSVRWKILLQFQCRNRLLLTGTPIQNTMAELWALLHFIMPTLFDSHEEFNEWFSKDIESHAENNRDLRPHCLHQLSRLHMILKPFMLRRIKKDVENELSDKIEVLVYCHLNSRQRLLYQGLKNKISIEDLLQSSMGTQLAHTTTSSLMNLVMQFRKVCNHPDLFERQRVTSMPSVESSPVLQTKIKDMNVTQQLLNKQGLTKLFVSSLALLHLRGSSHFTFINQMHSIRGTKVHGRVTLWQGRVSQERLKRKCNFRKNTFKCHRTATAASHGKPLLNVNDYTVNSTKCNEIKIKGKALVQLAGHLAKHHKMLEVVGYCKIDDIFLLLKPSLTRLCFLVTCNDNCDRFLQVYQCVILDWGKKCVLTPRFMCKTFSCNVILTVKRRLRSCYSPTRARVHMCFADKETLITDSGKLYALDCLLCRLKMQGHRVLIYSQMTRMIDLLEEYMVYRNHTYIRLDGSSKISERRDMVADFQTRSDIFVFLLSTRAGGLGINLTAADTVIFYDSDWNPTVDQQAMDRAHRLGQTKQVTVYRLICKGTIEERILQRAKEKSEIQKMVISGSNFKPDALKPKEVVSLLLDDEELEKKRKSERD